MTLPNQTEPTKPTASRLSGSDLIIADFDQVQLFFLKTEGESSPGLKQLVQKKSRAGGVQACTGRDADWPRATSDEAHKGNWATKDVLMAQFLDQVMEVATNGLA